MRNALNPGVLLLGSVLLSMVVLVRHSWELNVAFAAFSFVLIACCRRRTWRRIGALLAGLSRSDRLQHLGRHQLPRPHPK